MSLNKSVSEDDEDHSLRTPLVDDDYEGGGGVSEGPFPITPQKESYRDPTFSVVFYLHAILITALALGQGLPAVWRGAIDAEIIDPQTQEPSGDEGNEGAGKLILGLFMTLLAGAALSALAVSVLLRFGEGLVRCTLLGTVAWFGLCSAGFFGAGVISGGVTMAVLALFSLVYYLLVRKRAEFAGKNLRVACAAVSAMPGTVGAALLLLLVNVLWCLLWGFALVGVATSFGGSSITGPDGAKYPTSECSSYITTGPNPDFSPACDSAFECMKCVCGGVTVFADRECAQFSVNGALYAALLLSLYWGCTVVGNMVHCTTAGAIGAWWFSRHPGSSAVRDSLRRAATTSFGSICMASLLAAVVRVARVVLDGMRRNRGRMSAFLLAIVDCLLAAVDRVVAVFNRYALCHCAIYGSDLKTAGHETWALFGRRGWTAIINDQLIDNVLTLACVAVAGLCALGGWGSAWVLGVTHTDGVVLLALSGAVAGFFLASVAMSVVSSGVATIFVLFATDHLTFGATHPDLHLQLLQAWQRFHGPIMVHCGYTV